MAATDPHLALQGAAVKAMVADGGCIAIFSGRHYDVPPDPDTATFPYTTCGEGQSVADKADDYDGADSYVDIHVWSRAPGFPEAKRGAAAVKAVLDGASLALLVDPAGSGPQRLVAIFHTETRHLRDPDGLTRHSVVMFQAFTEPT